MFDETRFEAVQFSTFVAAKLFNRRRQDIAVIVSDLYRWLLFNVHGFGWKDLLYGKGNRFGEGNGVVDADLLFALYLDVNGLLAGLDFTVLQRFRFYPNICLRI